jgi:hypothetical protein
MSALPRVMRVARKLGYGLPPVARMEPSRWTSVLLSHAHDDSAKDARYACFDDAKAKALNALEKGGSEGERDFVSAAVDALDLMHYGPDAVGNVTPFHYFRDAPFDYSPDSVYRPALADVLGYCFRASTAAATGIPSSNKSAVAFASLIKDPATKMECWSVGKSTTLRAAAIASTLLPNFVGVVPEPKHVFPNPPGLSLSSSDINALCAERDLLFALQHQFEAHNVAARRPNKTEFPLRTVTELLAHAAERGLATGVFVPFPHQLLTRYVRPRDSATEVRVDSSWNQLAEVLASRYTCVVAETEIPHHKRSPGLLDPIRLDAIRLDDYFEVCRSLAFKRRSC